VVIICYFLPEPVFVKLLRSPGIDSQPGGIESSESIPGLLKRLQIRALCSCCGKKPNLILGTSIDGYVGLCLPSIVENGLCGSGARAETEGTEERAATAVVHHVDPLYAVRGRGCAGQEYRAIRLTPSKPSKYKRKFLCLKNLIFVGLWLKFVI
jgi:hypothetical protein